MKNKMKKFGFALEVLVLFILLPLSAFIEMNH
jgi:hypothetical protein